MFWLKFALYSASFSCSLLLAYFAFAVCICSTSDFDFEVLLLVKISPLLESSSDREPATFVLLTWAVLFYLFWLQWSEECAHCYAV